ncbi:hypothetical protein BKA61DRAFT_583420 [Leptodontidium sp. MPI-SDFR-AT-0119]|nr:hypothetical protein BKA61DRAFT_583420 [Leptodontidium sp. MPI-SDFR-AT-0119]
MAISRISSSGDDLELAFLSPHKEHRVGARDSPPVALWCAYGQPLLEPDSAGTDPTLQEMRNQSIVAIEPLNGQGTTSAANPDILAYGVSLDLQTSNIFRFPIVWKFARPTRSELWYRPPLPFILVCRKNMRRAEDIGMSKPGAVSSAIGSDRFGRCLMVLENMMLAGLTRKEVTRASVPLVCSSAWYAANLATGMKLYTYGETHAVQAPAIAPERMRLPLLKLVGELAIAVMGPGAETFEGNFSSSGVEWGNEAKDVDEEDFQFCEKLREILHSNDFQNFHEDGKRGFVGVTLRRREHRRA